MMPAINGYMKRVNFVRLKADLLFQQKVGLLTAWLTVVQRIAAAALEFSGKDDHKNQLGIYEYNNGDHKGTFQAWWVSLNACVKIMERIGASGFKPLVHPFQVLPLIFDDRSPPVIGRVSNSEEWDSENIECLVDGKPKWCKKLDTPTYMHRKFVVSIGDSAHIAYPPDNKWVSSSASDHSIQSNERKYAKGVFFDHKDYIIPGGEASRHNRKASRGHRPLGNSKRCNQEMAGTERWRRRNCTKRRQCSLYFSSSERGNPVRAKLRQVSYFSRPANRVPLFENQHTYDNLVDKVIQTLEHANVVLTLGSGTDCWNGALEPQFENAASMIQTVAKDRAEKYQILRDIFENQTTQPMAYNGSHKIQQPKARFATDVTSVRKFAEKHGLYLPHDDIPVSLAGLAYVSHEHLRNGMGTTGMHLRQDAQSMKKSVQNVCNVMILLDWCDPRVGSYVKMPHNQNQYVAAEWNSTLSDYNATKVTQRCAVMHISPDAPSVQISNEFGEPKRLRPMLELVKNIYRPNRQRVVGSQQLDVQGRGFTRRALDPPDTANISGKQGFLGTNSNSSSCIHVWNRCETRRHKRKRTRL